MLLACETHTSNFSSTKSFMKSTYAFCKRILIGKNACYLQRMVIFVIENNGNVLNNCIECTYEYLKCGLSLLRLSDELHSYKTS